MTSAVDDLTEARRVRALRTILADTLHASHLTVAAIADVQIGIEREGER